MAKSTVTKTQTPSKNTLEYLGIDFQRKLVKLFFEDKNFFISINHIVDQNMFSEDVLRRIVGYMKDRYNQTGLHPTYTDMELYIRSNVHDVITLDTIISTLQLLRETDLVGQDIVKEKSDQFFKQQNLTKAINKATEIIKSGDVSRYYDIEELFKKAMETNSSLDNGYNPMDNIDEALEENYRRAIPTGFRKLDQALYGGLGSGELGIIISPSGVGKAQPLTSRIITPSGYKAMGDIQVGDFVIGGDGKPYKVIGTYPQGKRPVYKVEFTNGTSCECDINHLWNVNTYEQYTRKIYNKGKGVYSPDLSFKTMSLKEMIDGGILHKSPTRVAYRYRIPINGAVEFNEVSTGIDPYIAGYYIGDGCYSRKAITVGKQDIVAFRNNIGVICKEDDYNISFYEKRNVYNIGFNGEYRKTLDKYFYNSVKSSEKYIPNEFKYNSIINRISLLQGLLDSDGYVSKHGRVQYSTKSETLANDVAFIVRSLGGFASIREKKSGYYSKKVKQRINCGITYTVTLSFADSSIKLCRYDRKQSRVKYRDKYAKALFIKNIEYLREDETKCIMVDSDEHTYLTEDFIVTHNTSATTGFAASAATFKCEDNDFRGYKVMHIHFEDEDVNIKRKYYGWITGVDAIDLSKPEFKEEVKKRLKSDLSEEARMIKENISCFHLPSGEVTVHHIEELVKQMIARGVTPDLIIIDYFECLAHEKGDKSDTEWTKEGQTMRKLEALAHKYNVGIWCPIQGTKDSFDKEIVGLSSGGGSVKKIQIGHVIITFARTQQNKKDHRMTVALEKFRAGRMDDSLFPNVPFNNGTCRFGEDEEQDNVLDEIAKQEDIYFQKERADAMKQVMSGRR